MSAVNEAIVREYFEMHGFLVGQPCKYVVPGRQKKAEEEVDLVVLNPRVKEHRVPEHVVWTGDDLGGVARAVVGIRGWHTERFYAKTFEQSPDILRFIESESIRFAARWLGNSAMAKILCLPRLPASDDLRTKALNVLKKKGVDGVIAFGAMLAELVYRVETHRNYEKSDLLQVLRLLKNYDLLKDSQLDLFVRKRRRRPKTG